MKRVYIEFTTVKKNGLGLPYVVSFPLDMINKIESSFGSQNCFLKVNDIEVEGSYNDLLVLLTKLHSNKSFKPVKEFNVYGY